MATDRETRSGLPSAGSTGEMSRPNNLQRIAQKKSQVRNYARNKKLEKLAVYSSCKVSNLVPCIQRFAQTRGGGGGGGGVSWRVASPSQNKACKPAVIYSRSGHLSSRVPPHIV